MQKGKKLVAGNTIGIAAPSGPVKVEMLEKGIAALAAMGFKVREATNLRKSWGYLAGTDEERARGLMELFDDEGVDGIVCAKGGYGANRMASLIDMDVIRANPKVFVGYSDITTLHLRFNQEADLITFHGPMVAFDMAREMDGFTEASFARWTMDGSPGELVNPEDYTRRTMRAGTAEGRLVGGNLNLIAYSIGTSWEIDTRGKILFIEEIEEEPYKVDGMLTQLYNSGKLQDCAGIVLGDWNNCCPTKTNPSLALDEVLEDMFSRLDLPVLAGLRAGHCEPKLTLPMGARCRLDADNMSLTVLEEMLA